MIQKMKKLLNIRPIKDFEIGIANSLIPIEWNFDLEKFRHLHHEENTYRLFGGFMDNRLMCLGHVVINGTSGWLENILVSPEFRNQGLGQEITMFLIEYLKKCQCRTILTIATESSKVSFQKLGFLTSSIYCRLTGELAHNNGLSRLIKPFEIKYLKQINEMDASATGEDRSKLLDSFVNNAVVFISESSDEIRGFYLPEPGQGTIIASNAYAGLALLQFKYSKTLAETVIPCENKIATDYLKKNHFRETAFIYHMSLGEDLDWKPEMIFGLAV